MRIINDNCRLYDFDAWSGAIDTKETIINNNMVEDFESLIDDLYPDGLTDTQLNDILWFDPDFIFESLGIITDDNN